MSETLKNGGNGRDNKGRFVKGHAVGRPKGALSGRAATLAILDAVARKAGNKKLLKASFQEEFEKNPAYFWKHFIMPLLPRETKLDVNVIETLDLNIFREIYLDSAELRPQPAITAPDTDRSNGDSDEVSP